MDDDAKLYEAYKIAIQGRNAHYELFIKWMSFFYVAIGAVFYAYFNLDAGDSAKGMLSLFGLVISFLGYLSCKGYNRRIYFWMWHVLRFESIINKGVKYTPNEINEKDYRILSAIPEEVYGIEEVHNYYSEQNEISQITLSEQKTKAARKMSKDKMLYPLQPANVSTSKISLLFFLIICLMWSHLVIVNFCRDLFFENKIIDGIISFILAVALTYLLIVIAFFCRGMIKGEKLEGHNFVRCREKDKEEK